MKKLTNIVTFASLFLLWIIIDSCSRDVAMIKIFSTYVNAVNQNDVSGALATHTQDAEFIIPGQHPIKGSEKIRSLLQWDSILQSQIMFDDLRVHGDTILAGAGSERNLWLKGIGLDSIAYTPGTRIVFEGELIRGIYPATLFSESRVEFGIRFQEFMS